jgi:hypothetical protein
MHLLTINGWQTLFGALFTLPALLLTWDGSKNLRCSSISQFYGYRLDKEYMNRFDQSFSKIYFDLKKESFCDDKLRS